MNGKTGDIAPSLRILAVSALWQGASDYGLVRAFRRAGHSVQVVTEDNFIPKWRSRPMRAIRRLGARFLEAEFNNALIETAHALRPDMLFVFKGEHLWPKTIDTIKAAGAIAVQFYPDTGFRVHSKNLEEAINSYDWFFTTKPAHLDELPRRFGCRNVSFMPHGFDPETHRKQILSQTDIALYNCDVSFIGNISPKKSRQMTYVRDKLRGIDLRIWGPAGWRSWDCPDSRIYQGSPVVGSEFAKALCASRINLGLLYEGNSDASQGDSITSRTFEIPASGGFMLHERTKEAMTYFKEGKECAYFSDADELIEKIKYYLAHENERRAIAEAGHRRCMTSGYSADDRINLIIAKYRQLRQRRKP